MTHPTENPFLEAGPDAILLDELTLAGRQSVLERLGPAGFRSKGFSFIGFLETLYDYIADQANGAPIVTTNEPPAEVAVDNAVLETPVEGAAATEPELAVETASPPDPVPLAGTPEEGHVLSNE